MPSNTILPEALDILRQAVPSGASTDPSGLTQIVADVERFIRRFVVLPGAVYLFLALWTIATHIAQYFDCFPYLALLSPAKRCGKTRLFEVLELLVHKPWRGTAPTPAVIFRMMAKSPTLFLDELDALMAAQAKSESAQTLLAVLNAGHRTGATIARCEGPNHELKYFPVYGPKAFASIKRLPDTLTDRSIVITMQRRTADQQVERFLTRRAKGEAAPVCAGIARFASTCEAAITQAYEHLMSQDLRFPSDRNADLWIPIFTLCSLCAPDRLAELKECAITLSGAKASDDADDSLSLKLLADIRAVWPEGQDRCETASLIQRLRALEESPWEEYDLSSRKLARMLRPFGLESRGIRVGERTPKGYDRDGFELAFSRYLAG